MDRPSYIYALHAPSDHSPYVYVGKSINPNVRYAAHLAAAKRAINTPKDDWIRSLQTAGYAPVLTILEETNDWENAERFYISYFRSIGLRVLNYTDGGDGISGITDVTREKMSRAKKGRVIPPEQRKKIAASLRGLKRPPRTVEHIQKIVTARQRNGKTRTLSTDHKNAIGRANKGRIFTEEHRANLCLARRQHTSTTKTT